LAYLCVHFTLLFSIEHIIYWLEYPQKMYTTSWWLSVVELEFLVNMSARQSITQKQMQRENKDTLICA